MNFSREWPFTFISINPILEACRKRLSTNSVSVDFRVLLGVKQPIVQMTYINPCFQSLDREYIFPIIDQKLAHLKHRFPQADILNLGVGDVALPLVPSVVEALCEAAREMGTSEGKRGYGPARGYSFLREAIADREFAHLQITPDEIFISDGANSDVANILDLFDHNGTIGIANPTYPAYLDSSLLAGNTKILFFPCLEENHFAPLPPKEHCDLIYLCSPNNPTGIALTREELKKWVDYARKEEAIILLDNAYEAFITSPGIPRSIFEIEGAKECAIEFRSFSKSAGFTGLRCAYTILPKSVRARLNGKETSLNPLWDRRQETKFNGVSYPVQRAAAAVYTETGHRETRAQVLSYLEQARTLREGLSSLGYTCYGGIDSPYVWWKNPDQMKSWDFFDHLLETCHLVCIPGVGFGEYGEGFMRLSAFNLPEKIALALERIQRMD